MCYICIFSAHISIWHQELNAKFSRHLRDVLSKECELDDAALISIDSKGIDIRVRQGAQVCTTYLQTCFWFSFFFYVLGKDIWRFKTMKLLTFLYFPHKLNITGNNIYVAFMYFPYIIKRK